MLIFVALGTFYCGILFERYEAKGLFNKVALWLDIERSYSPPFKNFSNKHEVDCESIDFSDSMVALTFGQSNSANHGGGRFTPQSRFYNFYQGKCYLAQDPLLGATGVDGSVWTRLGEHIMKSGKYRNVILVALGVESTSVSEWNTNGTLFQRIVEAKYQLDQVNIELTHLLWHQGETDSYIDTSKSDYQTQFLELLDGIRGLDINADLYLAIATRCQSRVNRQIQEAQLELVKSRKDILMGPNTDRINHMDDRINGCHFSEEGLKKHALLWMDALK